MTTLSDKFKITIRIADLPNLSISIKSHEEKAYRDIVDEINRRWEDRKKKVPAEDDKTSMAIIALRFAKQFYDTVMSMKEQQLEQGERQNELNKVLTDFENNIDNILLKIEE